MFRQTILKIFIDDYLKKGGKSPFGVVKKDVVWTRIFYVYTIKKNNENQRVPAKTRANIHYKRSSLHELLTLHHHNSAVRHEVMSSFV